MGYARAATFNGTSGDPPWQLTLGYHFIYAFSTQTSRDRVGKALLYPYYAIGILCAIASGTFAIVAMQGLDAAIDFPLRYRGIAGLFSRILSELRNRYELVTLFGMCIVIARAYKRESNLSNRRRIRWVVAGIVAGLFPLALFQVAALATVVAGLDDLRRLPIWGTMQFLANSCLAIIPVAVAYAVQQHEVMGIRFVLRRGLQYLLAKNFMRIALMLPAAALILPIVRNPDRTLIEILREASGLANLALLIGLILALRYRHALRTWLDRAFFREAFEGELILNRLAAEIQDMDSPEDVARAISLHLEAALHPAQLHLFYRDDPSNTWRLGYSSAGDVEPAAASLPANLQLRGVLEKGTVAVDYPMPEGSLNEEERAWMNTFAPHLVVLIRRGRSELAGLLLLGQKKSEEPYSAGDRALLGAIAVQAGLLSEKIALQGRVEREGQVRREVLAHLAESSVVLVKECTACLRCFDGTETVCPEDGSELQNTMPVERVLDGKYRLDRRIGAGGMGRVYEAADLRLGRAVAVKVITGNLFGNRMALRRFEREAKTAARLSHPNIVALHDFGHVGSDGAYLVMELLKGRTMRAALRARLGLSQSRVTRWCDQFLHGLMAAHEAGVWHRDLKPENIFISGEGASEHIRILDFGLAKLRDSDESETAMTKDGVVMGTMGYMAPEQLLGRKVSAESDVFSAGVIITEVLTGRRPFASASHAAYLAEVKEGKPLFSATEPGAAEWNEVMHKCLAWERGDRYADARELYRVLMPLLRTNWEFRPKGQYGDESETRTIPQAK